MHIVRSEFTRGLVTRWAVLVLLAFLAGCLAPSSPASGEQPSAAQKVSLEAQFPGQPKAQALAFAAQRGDAVEIRRLIKDEGVNPDKIFGREGMPLVAWPVFHENPTGLKALLENGADPNAATPITDNPNKARFKGRNKNNALVWASKEKNPIYLKLLLEHGGNPNTRNSNGETLLFQAAIWGNQWQNVQTLVEHGANVNEPDAGMLGPILEHYAGLGGFQSVYWLLEHGADPSVMYKPGPGISPAQSYTINSIFWHPGNPKDPSWQRKCQQWLLKHGYQRPPLGKNYSDMRKAFGFPSEEADIPLL
ncbi:ankyrin repeat domain-containing protein [Lysobacter sp. CA199]|uniref:ankyrin repeat domain-containing protein n=1 Tax=Lysobacter sp. CA199 TaxID=3455608 RepID=UPI003F8D0E98